MITEVQPEIGLVSAPSQPEVSNLEEAYDYALKTHEYIKYLNQLTDQRANFLIASSSIMLAAVANIGIRSAQIATESAEYWTLACVVVFIVLSIISSLRVILPKTFDADSPFHTAAIAGQSLTMYVDGGLRVNKKEALTFILRENHVVSRIVEYKSALLKKSAVLLFAAILVGATYWALSEVFSVLHLYFH